MYLWQGNTDTLYRIHGTVEPWTIGRSVSSGCIRMINQTVITSGRQLVRGSWCRSSATYELISPILPTLA
jgi:lipoprotein-anchoring transpeptidase ErfK/SrfK